MPLFGVTGFGEGQFAESGASNTCSLVATVPLPVAVFSASLAQGARLRVAVPLPVAVFSAARGGVGSVRAVVPLPVAVFSARGVRAWALEDDGMRSVVRGTTQWMLDVELRTLGGDYATGLDHEDVTVTYVREGQSGSSVPVPLSAGTPGAYSSGGWVELDPSGTAGLYQFGVPSAALASGAGAVTFRFEAAGCYPRSVQVQLVAFNPLDPVRLGLTALPSAAAGSEGGLALLDSELEVAAALSAPVELTAAYDAAKTAADADALQAVADAVTGIDAAVTGIRETDVVALAGALDTLALALSGLGEAVANLNDVDAAGVVSALMEEVVDTVTTFRTYCQVTLARAAGRVAGLGDDPRVETYYRDDAATPAMVHTTSADGLSRAVEVE